MDYSASSFSFYNPKLSGCNDGSLYIDNISLDQSLDEVERLLRRGCYEDASTMLSKAWWELVAYPPTANRQLAEAFIQAGWARLMLFRGAYAQAKHFALYALRLLGTMSGGDDVRTQASTVLSYVALYSEEFATAWRYGELAMQEANRSGDQFALATALNNKGNLEWHSGNLDAAIGSFEQALEIAIALDISTLISAIYGNLAGLYRRRGDLRRSLHYAQRSHALAEQGDDLLRSAYALLRVGMTDMMLGHHDAAKSYFDRAYIAAELGQNPMVLLRVLQRRAELAWLQGDYHEAALHANQILAANEEDSRVSVFASALLVHIAVAHGDLAQARSAYEQMVKSTERLSPAIAEDDQYLALTAFAVLRAAEGNWRATMQAFAADLRVADSAANPYTQGQVRLIYAGIALKDGRNIPLAYDLLIAAHSLFTRLGATYDLLRVTKLLTQLTYH